MFVNGASQPSKDPLFTSNISTAIELGFHPLIFIACISNGPFASRTIIPPESLILGDSFVVVACHPNTIPPE